MGKVGKIVQYMLTCSFSLGPFKAIENVIKISKNTKLITFWTYLQLILILNK